MFRLSDFAFDLCEDREPLGENETRKLCDYLEARGAHYKISSIHLNAWYGDYDKKTCLFRLLADAKKNGTKLSLEESLYIGDSPNDEPLFAALPQTIAVANIKPYLRDLAHLPTFITSAPAAAGFLEAVDVILNKRQQGK
jgi:3-deoxy-D-manno-octulosonate 8-phosphate phosphatase KdsC-like HAD superfamily phosphatase